MKIINQIGRGAWLYGMLLLTLLMVPAVRGQAAFDQILYAVANENGDNTVYRLNVDNGVQAKMGVIHKFGSEAGWSPDGKFIYLFDNNDPDHPTLTLVDADIDHRQTIPDPFQPSPCSLPFWWSPHDEWLAYSVLVDSQPLLKIMNLTTGAIQILADTDKVYPEVNWSSDGQYVAYGTATNPQSESFSIRDLHNQTTVSVLNVTSSYDMAWSPTENRIAYIDADSLKITIYNVADGTKQQYDGGRIGAWSPDGHFLTISHDDQDNHTLLSVIDVLAHKLVRFGDEIDKANVGTQARWSHDGHYLAITARNDNEDKGQIYILDVASKRTQPIKIDAVDHGELIWSPVANDLAFGSDTDFFDGYEAYTSLWLLNIDTNQSHKYAIKIPLYAYEQSIIWSATGRYMTVGADSVIGLFDWNSGKLSAIGDASQNILHPRWSLDGTKIALSAHGTTADDIYIFRTEDKTLRNITNTPDHEETFLGWRGASNGDTLSFCGEG